jgi:hypothetical protein
VGCNWSILLQLAAEILPHLRRIVDKNLAGHPIKALLYTLANGLFMHHE